MLVSASTIFIEVEIIQIDCAGSPSYDISLGIQVEASWEQLSWVIITRLGVSSLYDWCQLGRLSDIALYLDKQSSHAGTRGSGEAKQSPTLRGREREGERERSEVRGGAAFF